MLILEKPNKFQRVFLIGVFLSLCLSVLTRYQLLNGFSILSGDRYDAVISATILEHWFHVLTGDANWSEVNYFFPYTRTIAQTDAFFLLGVAYFPFRFIGLDPFISGELVGLLIKSFGFIGAYLLSRRVFSFSFYWALLIAILFTLSNGMTVHSSRIQLDTVAFAPIMTLLLWSTFKALLNSDIKIFIRSGILAGIFFGAWALTCFYMAWFFFFFFTVFMMVLLLKSGRSGYVVLKEKLVAHYGSVIIVVSSVLVSMLPFVYAFLPKSREVGVRVYESVFSYTVPIEGILQVGNENILFGKFYNYILSYISPSYAPNGEYYNTGFAIALFFLFVLGCAKILKYQHQQSNKIIFQSLVITTLVTWLLVLNIFGFSLWIVVYHIFPGAKALNVVAAYQLLLALPVVIIAVKYLSMQRLSRPVLLLLVVLLVASEFNKPYLNLNREEELARISLSQMPPKECRAFYVSGWKGQDKIGNFPEFINNYYAHNVTAMFIAQTVGIPTLNGFASFNPPDWNFGYPNNSDYDERVLNYSKKHQITGLCRLDLNSRQWSVIDLMHANTLLQTSK